MSTIPDPKHTSVTVLVPVDHSLDEANHDANQPHLDSERLPEAKPATEIGGRPGPDPTRYGDWEKNGRCIDF
jgi:hypothetical protein